MFDSFSLVEASITTFSHFTIDGTLQKDFFDTETAQNLNFPASPYCSWKELKPYCFSIIRGKLPPIQFKFVFQLSLQQYSAIFTDSSYIISNDQIRGLNLNIQYKNHELLCTTGISTDSFVFDKKPEIIWDSAVPEYLRLHQLDFDML
ncbi:DUF5721 family protein [Blautia sp. MSJ-19]|uniref:DUF5721 family protein n=1 Tax=Blautia sp. MSJ-19 TaxID=2841517 RepID=UPI00209F0922|nr:DUF5721 family protein [Blautia sp. MSJ-19]